MPQVFYSTDEAHQVSQPGFKFHLHRDAKALEGKTVVADFYIGPMNSETIHEECLVRAGLSEPKAPAPNVEVTHEAPAPAKITPSEEAPTKVLTRGQKAAATRAANATKKTTQS